MGELAVVVQAECLNTTILIFIKFNFVLYDLDSRFEDTFIFDSLSNFDLTGTMAFTLRWMCTRRNRLLLSLGSEWLDLW